jgi:hypothetical protein
MQHIGLSKYEQRFSERTTEALREMTELNQLRERVRLAEVAKGVDRPKLARSPLDPKVVDPFARSQLRDQPARLLATTRPSL